MNLKLENKVVLITGSGQGLGKGILKVFLEEGAKVVITDISQERIDKTETELKKSFPKNNIISFCGDLTKPDIIRSCVDYVLSNFERIDIFVANLGSGKGTTDWKISEDEWNDTIELNLNGARRMINEVIPHMLKHKYGSIVLISSIAGTEFIGAPIHYSVAKSSLISLSKNLSKKLARNNIRINTVCPGNIFFENGTWDVKMKENKEQVMEMLDKNVPQNRFASPEEIANMVVFISSDKCFFLTGSCIIMDGGQTSTI